MISKQSQFQAMISPAVMVKSGGRRSIRFYKTRVRDFSDFEWLGQVAGSDHFSISATAVNSFYRFCCG